MTNNLTFVTTFKIKFT